MEEGAHVEVFTGGTHTDNRGTLSYFNDLDLSPVKRFYKIEHPDMNIVRGWQGHQHEKKWFHVIAGLFKIVLVKPDNWKFPSLNLKFEEYKLDAQANVVLHVPGGYASGIQASRPNSVMIIFSDFSAQESLNDDFRFNPDKWYNWHSSK